MTIKMRHIALLGFLLGASSLHAQTTENFSTYATGLPSTTSLVGNEKIPVIQSSLPKTTTPQQILGAIAGDCTFTASIICTKTNGQGFAASATTDTTNALNIVSGTLSGARLPAPTAGVFGGVLSASAPSNQFMTGITTSGAPTFAQPSFANISGTLPNSQLATMAADTVKCNPNGSTGAAQDCTSPVVTGLTATSGVTSPNITMSAASPELIWFASGQGTDQKYWDAIVGGTSLTFRALNDTFTAANNWMNVTRGTGYTISNVSFFPQVIPAGGLTASWPSGLPISGTFTGGNVAALFGFNFSGVLNNTSTPEIGQQLTFTASAGGSVGASLYKVASYSAIFGSAGHAYIYAWNGVLQCYAGSANTGGCYTVEADMNQNGPDESTIGAINGSYGFVALTGGTNHPTLAFRAAGGTVTGTWSYGFACDNNIAIDCYTDISNSVHVISASGSHQTGIDFSAATFASSAWAAAPNNTWILQRDSGGTLRTILTFDSSNKIQIGGTGVGFIQANQAILPGVDNTWSLGGPSNRWTTVYATNGAINTSDRRQKKDFEPLPAALPIIMAVVPQTYHWREGDDHRRHWGLIAQDLDAAVSRTGVEFGGIDKSNPKMWGLSYAETNAILWKAVREQQVEIDELKRRVH